MKNKYEWYDTNNNFIKYSKIKSKKIYGKKMTHTKYAISIPAYNRPELLEEILNSAINQEYQGKYNIVVVDDYSLFDEKTDSIMNKYCNKYDNIYYYKNTKNLGPFGNFNRIFEITDSDWICLLHDDDLILPNYLSVMDKIDKDINKTAMIFNTNAVIYKIDTNKSFKKKLVEKINITIDKINRKRKRLLHPNYENDLFTPSCALYNKVVALKVGGLNDEFYPGSDVAYWQKLNFLGYDLIKTRKLVSCYRFIENDTLNINTQIKGFKYLCYFSKSYYNKMYKPNKAKRLYQENITKYYYNWINNFPESKKKLSKMFNKLKLDNKYYNNNYQKLITLKQNIRIGIIKVFK